MDRIVRMYCAATVWPATASNRRYPRPPAFSKVYGHLGRLSHRLGASLSTERTGNCRKIASHSLTCEGGFECYYLIATVIIPHLVWERMTVSAPSVPLVVGKPLNRPKTRILL